MWVLGGDTDLPIYRRIENLVLEHIRAGRLKPGQLLPSYPWLSRNLRVADKTVRQAYANLERAGALVIKRGKGTYVAPAGAGRSGVGGGRGAVGVLLPALPLRASSETIFWALLRGVIESGSAAHCEVLLAPQGSGDLRKCAPADGWVVWEAGAAGLPAPLRLPQTPVVVVGGVTDAGAWGAVELDSAGAARELAYRLVGLGHRQIGLLRTDSVWGEQAEGGYRHALGAAGLPVEPGWIGRVNLDVGETGLSTADALWAEGVSAILACREDLARVAFEAASRRGLRVPRDVSLAAVVESAPAPLPGGLVLDAMLLDAAELGRVAVHMLVEAASASASRREVVRGVRLEGASVGTATTGDRA
jgi:DNA-binding LacI/PurR family transcriptional regulator